MAQGGGVNSLATAFVELRADSKQLIADLQSGKANLDDAAKHMIRVEAVANRLKTSFIKLGVAGKDTFQEIDREATRALGKIPMQFGAITGPRTSGAFVAAMQRNRFAVAQVGFAVQDFVQVLSQPGLGLAAALRASTNNFQQMAFLLDPLKGAIFGVAIGIGAALIPSLLQLTKKSKEVEESLKDQRKAWIDLFKTQAKQAGERARGEGDGSGGGADLLTLQGKLRDGRRELNQLRGRDIELNKLLLSLDTLRGVEFEKEFKSRNLSRGLSIHQSKVDILRADIVKEQERLQARIQGRLEGNLELEKEVEKTEKEVLELTRKQAEFREKGETARAKERIAEIRAEGNRKRQSRLDDIEERRSGIADLKKELEVEAATGVSKELIKINRLEEERLKRAEKLGVVQKSILDDIKAVAQADREAAREESEQKIQDLKDRRTRLRERLADIGKDRGPSFSSAEGLAKSIQQSIGTTKEAAKQRERIREELEKINDSIQKQTDELKEAERSGRFAPGNV